MFDRPLTEVIAVAGILSIPMDGLATIMVRVMLNIRTVEFTQTPS